MSNNNSSVTYTTLLEDLRRYLERGFTSESDPLVYNQLPRLVTLAERRIARELKVEGFIVPVITELQPGVSVYMKPDRWRDTVSMFVDGKPVFARAYEYIRHYWPDPAQTGTPAYYADYDYQHWLIAPTPATAQTLEILYYEQPRFLGPDFQTNFITEYAPDMLLYGSLLEAAPYLKNDERLSIWQSLYDRAAQALNGEDLKRIIDRAAVRNEA
jgi:hypothetical protein